MTYYYYISGLMGMSGSGSFTRDKSRWMLFSAAEVERMTDGCIKPYGATKKGVFVIANQEA